MECPTCYGCGCNCGATDCNRHCCPDCLCPDCGERGDALVPSHKVTGALVCPSCAALELLPPREDCSWCNRIIRNGSWPVTHGICPPCAVKFKAEADSLNNPK